jgi:Tol biopolymer transport system component
MILFALALLAAGREDLDARLRHLDSAASCWAPVISHDGSRVAFLTTLFGTRQAASMAAEGGFPIQLTDEPGGVLAVRHLPGEGKQLLVVAERQGRRRLLLLDENGAPPAEVDPAPGDQFPGGFARDGKKLFYAVVDAGKVSLRTLSLETRKPAEVAPPPPAAGVQPAQGTLPLAEALAGLFALGPPAPTAAASWPSFSAGRGRPWCRWTWPGAGATS